MNNFIYAYILTSILVLPNTLFAQAKATVPDPDPELERKTFILPEGFEVNLYAADPLLAKPIQMNFDPQGRLWVACSEIYPHIKPGEKANDKILILEDTKGAGKADKVTVFADGLLIPTGVEPGDGGAYVANSTELLHLSASKKDGKADKTRVVLSGFGTEDTHHILHTLRWGPDGMLYFNQSTYIHSHIETPHGVRRLNGGGVWQFRPETNQLEVFVRGFINPWGHHFDRFGQSFMTDGANGEGITHGVPGFAYSWAIGVNRIHHGLNPGSPKHCGLEILSGSHLPEEYRGNAITNDFRGHRVCRFVLKDDGSTYASQEKTELIKSNHPAFRPIDVKMGPDGAIYIADWYNPIIQHGEVDFRDPRRDHTHGRIWRITAKGRPLVKKPDLVNAKTAELLDQLKSPEDWNRHQARRMLKERGAKEVVPHLKEWVSKVDSKDAEYGQHLMEALWTYQSLDVYEPGLLGTLLKAKDGRILAAAVRVLSQWHDRFPIALESLTACVAHDHPRVRLEAVRALSQFKSTRAMEIAMAALDKPVDRVLDYALWMTAKDLESVWLPAFKEGKIDFGGNARKVSFALDAAGSNATAAPIVKLLNSAKLPPDREMALWMLLARIGGPEELGLVLQHALGNLKTVESRAPLLAAVVESVRQRKIAAPPDFNAYFKVVPQEELSLIRLIGLWKLKDHRDLLHTYARDTKLPFESRLAAFDALVDFGGPENRAVIETLADSTDDSTRRLAIGALSAIDINAAAKRAAAFFGTAKFNDETTSLYVVFLNRKGGATALAKSLDGKKLSQEMAKLGVRSVRSSGQDAPDLVAALTKAGDLAAQKREWTKPELDAFVADVQKSGNAAKGELLYRRKDLQCLNCHAIGGAGGLVGPDLASIGASAPVDYLIESLLIPTKAVKEGYHTLRVETLDGKVLTGVKIRETKTEIALRTADDKEVVIPIKDIDNKRDTRSLMPDSLVDTLTREELIDLTRFLSELGKQGPYAPSQKRLIRRWQVLAPNQDSMQMIRRARLAIVAENGQAFAWQSAYSLLSGEVPLDAAPGFEVWKDTARLAVFRAQLDVTTGGKVKLKLNDAAGVTLFVGANPVDAADELTVDLQPGLQNIVYAIDLSKRKDPLRVEVEEIADSPARLTVVGGK